MYKRLDKNQAEWPVGLRELGKQEPKLLYYEGDISLLQEKCVCVVGSRRITDYGRRVVEKMVPALVDKGQIIVSGFMYGTDQAAHREAIRCGGKTVAVLGWGINNGFTNEDSRFKNEIVDRGGLIISEWENQLGALWTFPLRDRIMAALASDIYVVEAAIKSGSLITADWGIKLKRQIWAVPGPITSKVSEGTNWLITQGFARLWTNNLQIDILNDTKENELMLLLQNESLTADEISRNLGKPVAEIGAQLSMLELEGKVVDRGGKYYINS